MIFAIIVYLIGRKIVKFALKLTNKWMVRREVEISVQKFIMSLAGVVYNLLLIFIVAGILGVGTSSIVAMVGSAGLAVGLWESMDEIQHNRVVEKVFTPEMDMEKRNELYAGWKKAVECSKGWAK